MNDITARFAAMAERARKHESSPPMTAVYSGNRQTGNSGRQNIGGPSTADALRQPAIGASLSLDQKVAEELASLDLSDPPPPAIDPHDGPLHPKTNDARDRAIAYVSRLISDYTSMRRNPGSYKVGLTGKLDHLRAELGIMQSAGKDGETLARRWDFVVGDGKGGQYGARSIA